MGRQGGFGRRVGQTFLGLPLDPGLPATHDLHGRLDIGSKRLAKPGMRKAAAQRHPGDNPSTTTGAVESAGPATEIRAASPNHTAKRSAPIRSRIAWAIAGARVSVAEPTAHDAAVTFRRLAMAPSTNEKHLHKSVFRADPSVIRIPSGGEYRGACSAVKPPRAECGRNAEVTIAAPLVSVFALLSRPRAKALLIGYTRSPPDCPNRSTDVDAEVRGPLS